MEIVNRGNFLHFYTRKEHQWRYRYGMSNWGLLCLDSALMAFQLPVSPVPVAFTFTIKDLSDNTVHTIDAAKIQTHCDGANATKYHTYDPKAVGGLGVTLDCGFYYIEADIDGTIYYSEVLHVVDSAFLAQDDIYRIEVWNANDTDDVLYSEGYQQFVHLRGYWLFSQIEEEDNEILNGQSEVFVGSGVTKERKRLECPNFHDHWLYCFSRIRNLSNKRIRKMDITPTLWHEMKEYRFTSREDEGGFLSVGQVTWVEGLHSFSGCQEDKSVVPC